MLAQFIKSENGFILSIRIKGFCIFKDKLTLFFLYRLRNMFDMASMQSMMLRNTINFKSHLVSTFTFLILLTRKV